jgi:hypothetical protein
LDSVWAVQGKESVQRVFIDMYQSSKNSNQITVLI